MLKLPFPRSFLFYAGLCLPSHWQALEGGRTRSIIAVPVCVSPGGKQRNRGCCGFQSPVYSDATGVRTVGSWEQGLQVHTSLQGIYALGRKGRLSPGWGGGHPAWFRVSAGREKAFSGRFKCGSLLLPPPTPVLIHDERDGPNCLRIRYLV